jgi:hypothetical protein
MDKLLRKQDQISPQRGMPVDDTGHSSTIISVTGETIQLYYSNAGARTIDAGQAAGVAVQGQLAYENIQDSTGTMCGTKADSSLSFTSGAFTTEVDYDWHKLEAVDDLSFARKLALITADLANGEYVVDYSNGTLWGKKASTAVSLAAGAYKIKQGVSAAAASVTPNVNLAQVAGTATVVNNGLATAGAQRVVIASDNTPFAVKTDQTTHGTTDLVAADLTKIGGATIATGAGTLATGVQRVVLASDDAAVTALQIMDDWDETDRCKVNPIAGQVGVAANSGASDALTQRVILATNDQAVTSLGILDDTVVTDDTTGFTAGAQKAIAIAGAVDDTGTDTADEGDMVCQRFSARRAAYVTLDTLIEGEDQTNHLMKVGGPAATGAAATGNPILVSGLDGASHILPLTNTTTGLLVDTELPAAAALADATANPTTTSVGALGMGYNGSTWDRLQVDASKFLKTSEQYMPVAEDNTNGVIATARKPLAVTTYCWSVDQSAALEASSVTKAAAGVIRSIFGRIDSTAASGTYYIQFLNASSLPADGAVTHLATPYKIIHTTGSDSYFSVDFLEQGLFASTGIVIDLSSTEFTKTIGGAYLSMTIRFA